jgi:vacuolar-type H+-ATPase subunit I/STV1
LTKTTPNKKIFFDRDNAEEGPIDENDVIDGIEPTSKEVGVNQAEDSDSDDDDAVEEVKSSVARETIMEQRAKERETVKEQKLQIRTKKRKKTAERKQLVDEDEFDEEFFAQVDSEMATQRKQKKEEKDLDGGPAGRHTTFVSAEEGETTGPIKADHNIEIVVLGDEGLANSALIRSTEAKAGIEPTEASHLFARNRLANGKEQAKKKGTKKKKQDDPGWKRSKKMNVLAVGRAKVQRRKGCGTAASNFVVKS